MRELDMSADEVVSALLGLSEEGVVCILDSGGVGHLGSHLLVAGVSPVSVIAISDEDPEHALAELQTLIQSDFAVFFTMSYSLGARLQGIVRGHNEKNSGEPGIFAACFDTVIIHDYDSGTTYISDGPQSSETARRLPAARRVSPSRRSRVSAKSNFTRNAYIDAVEAVKDRIRSGDTYQTNLTQQFNVELAASDTPQNVFLRLRRDHPAPFAAYFGRGGSTVVSASPERFFRVENGMISTSPIKGTRPRVGSKAIDDAAMRELLASSKDIAENTMIVDLMRNDLGRVCEFGSVRVEKLCALEQHPTLFHLVSTVSGELARGASFSDIVRAMFPCGSITGAPKISTMRMIDELETADRGLSMGAIGYHLPGERLGLPESLDTSVAIRTMVIRNGIATFNVGGGIVIDSDPSSEYLESLDKAAALLRALGAEFSY